MNHERGSKKRPGTHAEHFSRKRLQKLTESEIDNIRREDYITINGLQYALPYNYMFSMQYQPRWGDQTLFAVFTAEFSHVDSSYWDIEFRANRVLVNGVPATTTTKWVPGLRVEHAVHRHESAILAREITLLYTDSDLVAVDKPASLPVHPCGTYRRNSLQFCVAAQLGLRGLFVVHRLDKETSGVVIFARNKAAAVRFNEHMKQHAFSKTYLAEVHGHFPFERPHECKLPLIWDTKEKRAKYDIEHGKEAQTTFRLLEYRTHSDSSLVEARPTTGRTHQIRVHLAQLGYPIVDDPIYGGHTLAMTTTDPAIIGEDANIDDIGDARSALVRAEGVAQGCTTCPRLGNARAADGTGTTIRLHAARYARGTDWGVSAPPPAWGVIRRADT